MKKFFTSMLFAFVAIAASAQSPNATYIRIDFNLNPWNLPVSIPNRDKDPNGGWGINWALVDDETGCFEDTHTFDWPVSEGETIQMVLTPSNWKLTDYMNAMVKTHNLDMTDEPVETMLWMRRGSTMTFKAPKSMWFEKMAFDKYRNWANGSLYSSEVTNNQTVWGKDSVKVRNGLDCWSGDSVEWSLPECTGNSFLRYIDVWLLPRDGSSGISTVKAKDALQGNVYTVDGVLLRRNGKLEGLRKGIYIIDGRKYVVK